MSSAVASRVGGIFPMGAAHLCKDRYGECRRGGDGFSEGAHPVSIAHAPKSIKLLMGFGV
jgi:hypothetical protein